MPPTSLAVAITLQPCSVQVGIHGDGLNIQSVPQSWCTLSALLQAPRKLCRPWVHLLSLQASCCKALASRASSTKMSFTNGQLATERSPRLSQLLCGVILYPLGFCSLSSGTLFFQTIREFHKKQPMRATRWTPASCSWFTHNSCCFHFLASSRPIKCIAGPQRTRGAKSGPMWRTKRPT